VLHHSLITLWPEESRYKSVNIYDCGEVLHDVAKYSCYFQHNCHVEDIAEKTGNF